MTYTFDIVVVGAGHAGCEAASVAANLGSKVLLITMDLSKIAQMSCNPAVGGIAKGQIVREIDALGGTMAKITDKTTLQFRMLNKSKGPSMWSPRAQCDRFLFSEEWQKALYQNQNIFFWQDSVIRLIFDENFESVKGVETLNGISFYAKKIILTNGTFLNGSLFIGKTSTFGGRTGELSSLILSDQLSEIGFQVARMKTGTPVRIDKRTINFARLEEQKGDENLQQFSYNQEFKSILPQQSCYITHTNETTHEILKTGFKDSPLLTGKITGIGPRYCPSIEDKLKTFADKTSHQLFIEPESLSTIEYYLNGFSSSLPFTIQQKALNTINGMEKAQIIKSGYAVEYDYFQPTQLHHTLETKKIKSLYFAGQINGTTGYEEAAAQGVIAGINAHFAILNKGEFVLQRNEAYIGVLIDDLVTKGVDEPYRMFTSRAEYRLTLRYDNADIRLLDKIIDSPLFSPREKEDFLKKKNLLFSLVDEFEVQKLKPKEINPFLTSKGEKEILEPYSVKSLLLRPKIFLKDLVISFSDLFQPLQSLDEETIQSLESLIKYQPYENKQELEKNKVRNAFGIKLSKDFPYEKIPQLSTESKSKLLKYTPKTLQEASEISGIKPSDLIAILSFLKR